MNTGDPAVGFRRRSGGSTTMPGGSAPTPFAPVEQRSCAQLAADSSLPLAADSCPPLKSEQPPPTIRENAPSTIAMVAFGKLPQDGSPRRTTSGNSKGGWGKAREKMDLPDEPRPNTLSDAIASWGGVSKLDGNRRSSFTNVIEGAIETRKLQQKMQQENSNYFNPSVIASVNRHRRMQRSRRTRMMMLLDEPRSSRLASIVFIVMLCFIFLSVRIPCCPL